MKYGKNVVVLILFSLITLALLIFIAANNRTKTALTEKEMQEDYEYMWKTLEENFPLFEVIERKTGIRREEIYKDYKAQIANLENNDVEAFYAFLSECLANFNGFGHLSVASVDVFDVYYNMTRSFASSKIGADVKAYARPQVVKTYEYLRERLEEKKSGESNRENAGRSQWLLRNEEDMDSVIDLRYYENIPVIKITSFTCESREAEDEMSEKFRDMLKECGMASDIVIDVRGNAGGTTRIWQNAILPYLAQNEAAVTTYSACINGELNQTMFPIDLLTEHEYIWNDYIRYELTSAPISTILDSKSFQDTNFENLCVTDFERCNLFLETKMILTIPEEAKEKLQGNLWIAVDEKTASAAFSLASMLQNAGAAKVIGPPDAGYAGGLAFLPSQSVMTLPNSNLIVRFAPYYILNRDGSCSDFGMLPDVVLEKGQTLEWWLWMKSKEEQMK